MNQKLYDLIEANSIITAVENMEGLDACCQGGETKAVLILFGDVRNISTIVEQIKASDKVVAVRIDLIIGLSSREVTADFIRSNTSADGIISTKPTLIKRVREPSLYTTLRVFVLDSMAFENIEKQMSMTRPDVIEILPGLIPKVIRGMCKLVKVPTIAGRLVSGKEDAMAALSTGAMSVSTTNQKVWLM